MLLNIFNNILATICVAVPVFNFMPHTILTRKKILLSCILLLLYCIFFPFIGAYINLFALPIFMFLTMWIIQKCKTLNYIMSILGYLFTVTINNIVIGILLKFGINVFTANIFLSFLFQILYFCLMAMLTWIIGKKIREKRNELEFLYFICNTFLKKIIIVLPITIVFIGYLFLIVHEASKNNAPKIIVKNSIFMSVLFSVIILLYICLMIFIFKKIKKYEKNIDNLSIIYNEINRFDEKTKTQLVELIKSEENDKLIKQIIFDFIYKN